MPSSQPVLNHAGHQFGPVIAVKTGSLTVRLKEPRQRGYHVTSGQTTGGDTIVILSEGNVQHKIRLQAIDAPECGQAYGTNSREHLSDLVAGRFVVVEYDKRDRYGRIVGKVLVGGEDGCLEQVSAGHSWHYKKYWNEQSQTDRQPYSEAEIEVRKDKRGLWQDPHAIPAWEYWPRKRNSR